ncbi:hypothetical protein HCN44_006328 [Aphidius gifuensis]|uniref:Sjoegren syndrome nuclear autoantigen 1 n=1 Tax=Aphidius gifuensis TaxID=684658 RepID=A0A834XTN7_APHGI|nr:Sjoegren syndrome nuclear autoantigen 1 homolog isoform X2 [Aphidius gifuensis]KAF7993268.1 hypothetical protein HCN44_006328 [Aphidius gifuensis]
MSQHGAALQTYNQELVKYLEDMKQRRAELQKQIDLQEEDKITLEKEIEKMSTKLIRITDCLGKRISVRNEYDKTITETEAAYTKILESSQLLLNMLKREASVLHETLIKVNIDQQHRRQ